MAQNMSQIGIDANLIAGCAAVGIEYDFTAAQPSPTLNIIDINGNVIANPATLIAMNPLFNGIKRCNLANDGHVTAWWGDSGFSYTGSNGQCMTQFPMGYYKQQLLIGTSTKKLRRWVSAVPWGGFRPHPAFITNGKQLNQFYLGTFPASIYDSTTSTYNLTDAAYTSGDTNYLASIAGVGGVGCKPLSGLNNAAFTQTLLRTIAQKQGAGWNLATFQQDSWISLLAAIKYGTFNLQNTYTGVTNITDDNSTNMAVLNGATAGYGGISGASDLGNTDGQVTVAHYKTAQTTWPFNLLGVENFYGNIWVWADGLKINNYVPWVADNGFNDSTPAAPYINTGVTLPSAFADYVTQVANSDLLDYGFLPMVGGGSSSTGLTDGAWTTTGLMAALFGGCWSSGANAGAFYWDLNFAASNVYRNGGARLAFFA